MTQSDFDPKPSVMVGDTADIGIHRSMAVLRSEGINPVVSVVFVSTGSGIFCGINEVKALLGKVLPESNRSVWALQEGSEVNLGEVALAITAPYSSFALYETAIRGILSHCTGWATASRECVNASGSIPVISMGANLVHPAVAGTMDYSAVIGGCVSCSTSLGGKLSVINPTGGITPNAVLLMGDPIRAMQNFDKNMPQDIPRMCPVNIMKDEIEEALSLAKVLGQRLRGVVLDVGLDSSPNKVKELRARLELAGHAHVEIFLKGDFTPKIIGQYIDEGVAVSAFGVSNYIGSAIPKEFKAQINEVEGQPFSRRGVLPGPSKNTRLVQVLQ